MARTGQGSVAGSNSLINLSGSTSATFNLGGTGSLALGPSNLFTINVLNNTANSGQLLASDGSYTINLVQAYQAAGSQTVGQPTNFTLNGAILNAGHVVDQGTINGRSGTIRNRQRAE